MTADNALVRVVPCGIPPGSAPSWAEGMAFRLPAELLSRSGLAAQVEPSGRFFLGEGAARLEGRDADSLRMMRAFTDQPPASTRLPFSYRAVPAWARSLIATGVGHLQRRRAESWAQFPMWPLDLSADFLSDIARGPRSPFATGPTPVLLTHDLDSAEGLSNLVRSFLQEEEKVGARSTSFVVPRAWPLDHGLLDEVKQRGHGLGVHGYDHSNLTPFLEAPERRRRIEAAQDLVERYGIKGYRAPSLLRTRQLLQDLARHYRYDSSIPTSGGLFPVPNNGCASARPFVAEGIVEIPVTLPRDGSLRFLGHTPAQMLELWIGCAEAISRSGGIVVLLTHCEERFSGAAPMLEAYRNFLAHIRSQRRYAWSTPEQVMERFLREHSPNRIEVRA